MLRTILIMLVVLLHIGTPGLGQLDYGNPYELIRFFFQDELGRLSVPTLTAISGYLLFSSKLDLAPATSRCTSCVTCSSWYCWRRFSVTPYGAGPGWA